MKIARYLVDGRARVGVVEDGSMTDAGTDPFKPLHTGKPIDLAGITWLAPVIPSKVVGVGLNYRDHAREAGQPIPQEPILFAKWPNSVVGHGSAIVLPSFSSQIDYEAELGVIIGRRARNVSRGVALNYVFGYTCLNDVSARDVQARDGQWVRGKSLDTFCPMGPWIVTADEVPDPQRLAISCDVNGVRVQSSSTAEMIFGVAELIEFISEAVTLEPGDVIATGTPSGVGVARKPQLFLSPGATVSVEIEGIGTLTNPVVGQLRLDDTDRGAVSDSHVDSHGGGSR